MTDNKKYEWVKASEQLPAKIDLTTIVRYIKTKTIVYDFLDFIKYQPQNLSQVEWLKEIE